MLNEIVQLAQGFHSSVNISFDLTDESKVESFIPTAYSIDLLNELFGSIAPSSTQRAQILIGAYGRGKSHIMLVLLNMLFNKKEELFERLLKKTKEIDKQTYSNFESYIKSDHKLLPVIITGSSNSLTQSFLGALQQTTAISENLGKLMPETHFVAALNVINTWEKEYPETYASFANWIPMSLYEFKAALKAYDVMAYEEFERIYPKLTAGSTFNPFSGLDVVGIYEKFVEKLVEKTDYNGIYIVYDEFSKYLESSIGNATISDVKLLQDFAEKCNRSGKKQMHLTLISHKDIGNYIDEQLPKDKVDGWRGVSGRFKHLYLQNNYSQMYEVIASVIVKKPEELWDKYKYVNREKFQEVKDIVASKNIGLDTDDKIDELVYGCYPLQPMSTFILPRISEKIAQNERTLFTFLSDQGKSTLNSFIKTNDKDFALVTPDYIYDYFETLLQREPFNSEIKKLYYLTAKALRKTQPGSLEAKILKTICLIYIVGQFEKLAPTEGTIIDIFKYEYNSAIEINNAINSLISQESVVYLKRSNNYLKLKESSGVNIIAEINNQKAAIANTCNYIDILNETVYENYIYPNQYNTDKDIIRYFDFKLISSFELRNINNLDDILADTDADGIVFAVVPCSSEDLEMVQSELNSKKYAHERIIFVTLKKWEKISELAIEYKAVSILKDTVVDDDILFEEYELYYDDLNECLTRYLSSFSRPEQHKTIYYYNGEASNIQRKANLSNKISEICQNVYEHMPIINNESLNKNVLPGTAISSRNKVVDALLENELRSNLGLSGNGQDVSFMRSILVNTGLISDITTRAPEISLEKTSEEMRYTMNYIFKSFFEDTIEHGKASFEVLYSKLTAAKYGVGLKKGVIPVLLAVAIHEIKNDIVISDITGELKITSETINKINENPSNYYVQYEQWNKEKASFLVGLERIFDAYIRENEKAYGKFTYLVFAMNRWFMSLPRYSKEMRVRYLGAEKKGVALPSKELKFINSVRSVNNNPRKYLIEQLPHIFNGNPNEENIYERILSNILDLKMVFENAFSDLQKAIACDLIAVFSENSNKASLKTSIENWYKSLKQSTKNHAFPSNENKFMEFCSTITNNEQEFVNEVCRYISGLEMEDWSEETIVNFNKEIALIKETIENYNTNITDEKQLETNSIKVVSVDAEGNEQTKTYGIVEYSNRAKLLLNMISNDLEGVGDSVTREEKRRILFDLLESI